LPLRQIRDLAEEDRRAGPFRDLTAINRREPLNIWELIETSRPAGGSLQGSSRSQAQPRSANKKKPE